MSNEEDMPANMSAIIQILTDFVASSNITVDLNDLTHEEIYQLLQRAGVSLQEQHEIDVGLDEEDLMIYKDYQIHRLMSIYVPPILLFLGTIGNILSFFILRHKTMTRLSTNTFLAALSVADSLVLLIGLFRKWLGEIIHTDIMEHSRWLCKIGNVLVYSTSQYSVWLIVAVTIERYIVVCHPLRASRFCNIPRARKVVVLLLFLFFAINFHLLWTVDLTHEPYNGNLIYKCEGVNDYRFLVNVLWPWIDALIYSFIPTLVIIISNILIIRQVIKATFGRDVLQNGSLIKQDTRRNPKGTNVKLTVMLLTISFTFLLTTLPMNIVMIASHVWRDGRKEASQLAKTWLIRTIAELLMYLNHSINFFLYCATGQKFRNIVFRMVCRRSTSNTSNASDHSQHLYCSRTNLNACSQKISEMNETAI